MAQEIHICCQDHLSVSGMTNGVKWMTPKSVSKMLVFRSSCWVGTMP